MRLGSPELAMEGYLKLTILIVSELKAVGHSAKLLLRMLICC